MHMPLTFSMPLSKKEEGVKLLVANRVLLRTLCNSDIGQSQDAHVRFYAAMILANLFNAGTCEIGVPSFPSLFFAV